MKGSRVLSIGFNRPKSSPHLKLLIDRCSITEMYDTSKTGYMSCNIHAETNALKRLKSDADTLFVVRRDMNGRLTMAKPCNVCMAAIRQTNIRKIFFSNERGEIEMIKL